MFPKKILKPIQGYLGYLKKKYTKRYSNLEKEDPYNDTNRLNENNPDDDANEESGHERVAALKEQTQKNIERVEKALDRIKKGTYGKCSQCGKMIDTERLAIDPTMDCCVQCQSKSSPA